MRNSIIQCCYTNASQEIAGKISSGWQPVAVSPDISPDAYSKCTEIQNINSTIENAMVDEEGNLLNLYEICGDGTYVYILRTQYGLLDRLGRANMFSHAFIFSWNNIDVLSDPNSFLTVANENFKSSVEDAGIIPEDLIRTDKITLKDAMSMAGLNYKTYLALIQCVYTQMTDRKIGEPLYIQYDGTEIQMKAILFCIYYGLPFYLRKLLCIASATANKPSSKHIIFSRYAERYTYYFVTDTGQNNILSPRVERKIERYGFVDYVAKNIEHIDAKAYFTKLESYAQKLNNSSASNELILKISHQFMLNSAVDTFSDDELEERLSDALRSKSQGSSYMEQYIAEMVNETYARNLVLTDENEESLDERLAYVQTKELLEAGKRYNIYRLSSLPIPEAAQKLSSMIENVFNTYSNQLAESEKGLEILDYYYAEIQLSQSNLTWDVLKKIFDESSYVYKRPKTIDKLEYIAWNLYCSSLTLNDSERSLNPNPDYGQYIQFMRIMSEPEQMAECETAAKEEFWEHINFSNFSFDLFSLYKEMYVDVDKCKCLCAFFNLKSKLKNNNEKEFLEAVNRFFLRYGTKIGEKELIVVEKRLDQLVQSNYLGYDRFFEQWCNVFSKISIQEMAISILAIRDALVENNYKSFVEEYKIFIDNAHLNYTEITVSSSLNKLIKHILKKYDDESANYVPLDAWLCIGNSLYKNAFEILEDVKPAILEEEALDVIEESILFKKKEYIHQAENYIQCRGEMAKVVKKWLNELRRLKKQKKVEKEQQEKESLDNVFFSRGLSVLSKVTQESISQDSIDDGVTNNGKETGDKHMFKGFFKRK